MKWKPHFVKGQFEAGVIAGIHAVGNQLREYFPSRSGRVRQMS